MIADGKAVGLIADFNQNVGTYVFRNGSDKFVFLPLRSFSDADDENFQAKFRQNAFRGIYRAVNPDLLDALTRYNSSIAQTLETLFGG